MMSKAPIHRLFFTGAIAVVAVAAVVLLFSPSRTQALSVFDIEYPIPELGDCADRLACKAYCDDLSHKRECLEFARKYQLIEAQEIEQAEQLPDVGPGGCQGEAECRAYCEDSDHTQECVTFAVDHGFMPREEADRILAELNKTGPGGCRGFEECEAYCEDPSHFEECVEYAYAEGIISDEERELAKRVGSEGGPGGCRSHEECRAYCEDPERTEECLSFAEEKGFVSPEEAQRLRKLGAVRGPGGCRFEECRAYCDDSAHEAECFEYAVQNGLIPPEEAKRVRNLVGKEGPGGCRGRQCEEYCEDENHTSECLDFAVQNNLIPPEQAARAQKFLEVAKDGGPGGCRGRECEDYCEDSSHQEECFSFAKEQGLLTEDDKRDFEAGQKLQKKLEESGGPGGCKTDDECRSYCSDPKNTEECVAFAATHGGVSEDQARAMLKRFTEERFGGPKDFAEDEFRRRFEEQAGRRFEEFKLLEEQFRGEGFPAFRPPGGGRGFGPPEGFGRPSLGGPEGDIPGFVGPGGCTSPAECIKYCKEHTEECFSFGPPGRPGVRPPEGGVPPGHDAFGPGRQGPSLRSDLIRQFRPEDFPPDFQRLSPEERERIFREQSGFSGEGEERSRGGGGSSRIRLKQEKLQGGFNLEIRDSEGIREFRLNPVRGSVYSGGLDCSSDYSSFIQPESSDFPIEAKVTDCQDNETTIQLQSPFRPQEENRQEEGREETPGFISPEGRDSHEGAPFPSLEGRSFEGEFPREGFTPGEGFSPEDIQRQFEADIRVREERRITEEIRRQEEERIRRELQHQGVQAPPLEEHREPGTFNEFFQNALTPPPISEPVPALLIPPPSQPPEGFIPSPTETVSPPPADAAPQEPTRQQTPGAIGFANFLGIVVNAFVRFVQ